ncbi:MAG: hypothetical protein OEY20_12650 [Gemmatimonadota bacterium]|nr:hypothetical protein [Gemmatimonadota bacterium]MDH5198086.1 hypothetical protein [Gemmatimonadota bacterium]
MLRPRMMRAALGLLLAAPATAQTYNGSYAAQNDQGGQTVVTLRQQGDKVTGTIVGNGSTLQLEGALEAGTVVGAVTGAPGGGLWFEAELDEATLYLTLIAAGTDGRPDYERMSTVVFARQGAAGAVAAGGNPLGGGAGPLAAHADPWVGTFSDGSLVLELQGGSGGEYSGSVAVGGQRFPVVVRGSGASLSGSFRSPDGEFPLTLQETGGRVVVSTGGATYTLQRGGTGAAANPLAGGTAQAGGFDTQGGAQGGTGAAGGGGIDDGTALGREWSAFLAGKKATKMSSYSSGSAGGYSSRTDVHLCANGQFAMRGSDLVSVDVGDAGGYSGGSTGGQGTWRIITQGNVAGIELRYADGQAEQHRLDYEDNKTYVDGERWLVTPSEACGGGD